MADRKLIVQIVGDSTSYERSLSRANKATSVFNANLAKTTTASQALRGSLSATKAGGGLGGLLFGSTAFVAAAIASKAIAVSINAASDLNEQISRTRVVLGKSADAMIAWSKTTATSIGISQRAALAAVGTFAGLFQTVGVGRAKAGDFSRVLVKLAADLASLQNSSPEEALIALRSGLAGEAEPLRRFNIFLSESRVQMEALAETGKTATSSLTQQEKTVARYNLILRDGAIANNNFKDTSSGLANEQRTLKAETDDLAASVGSFLVPAMQGLAGVLIPVVAGLNDAAGAMGRLHKFFQNTKDFDGWNKGVEETGDSAAGFFKKIRDGIPGMEHFLDLRDRFVGGKSIADQLDALGPGGFRPERESGRGGTGPEATTARAAASAASAAIAKATARANATLDQQIKDSASRIAHLKDLIREDPTNAKLQQRLTAEIRKQNGLIDQQRSLNQSNAAAAKSAAQAAHTAAVQAIADQREAKRAAAEQLHESAKRSQFSALGLTAEGLKPTPGSGSLLKRAQSLQDQIKGTSLDTSKTRTQLQRIISVLKKHFKTAGKDVRQAILSMLNDISSALDSGKSGSSSGPLTKTTSLNSKRVLAGLGLSPEEVRALRSRLSNFNSAGIGLAGARTGTTGSFSIPNVVVENNITVAIDGTKVTSHITKEQQKQKRRNPQQKRGPHRK